MRSALLVTALFATTALRAASPPVLPAREPSAPGGAALADAWRDLPLAAREAAARAEVLRGNVPESWKQFAEVHVVKTIAGKERVAILRVAPDYLAVGRDGDALFLPLSPQSAQAIADSLQCVLPTRALVDAIHAAATKVSPLPLAPSPAMTTMAVFAEHNAMVAKQRAEFTGGLPPGTLVAGYKKDVVLTPRLASAPGKVAIYGWHRDGAPIQPLHLGHTTQWVDYSHGIRLVDRTLHVDGAKTTLAAVLADPELHKLVSDEGACDLPRYPLPASAAAPETWREHTLADGVRALVQSPASVNATKPVHLAIFAAPAGNTVEQTFGRRFAFGDDWHHDIQHIAAQTRWLREVAREENLVVAVVQCAERSWVAWKKKYADAPTRIAAIVDTLRQAHGGDTARVTLAAHSAGGAFLFGYVDAHAEIPAAIERIAFLDANYAYAAGKNHAPKLARWLATGENRALLVLAYHDSIALLDGKTFVSESGGTWGRSHAMLRDLEGTIPFTHANDADWQRATALGGRVAFLLKENPTRAILHTRLVEWNGFIHALRFATPRADEGYRFFGPRAYEAWISGGP